MFFLDFTLFHTNTLNLGELSIQYNCLTIGLLVVAHLQEEEQEQTESLSAADLLVQNVKEKYVWNRNVAIYTERRK